eukprot:7709542-Alexandrium_andersonii.AAC.1
MLAPLSAGLALRDCAPWRLGPGRQVATPRVAQLGPPAVTWALLPIAPTLRARTRRPAPRS